MQTKLSTYKNKYFQVSYPNNWDSMQNRQLSEDYSYLTLIPISDPPWGVFIDFMLLGKPQQDYPLAVLRQLSTPLEGKDIFISTTRLERIPAFLIHYIPNPKVESSLLVEVSFIQSVYAQKAFEFRYMTHGLNTHQRFQGTFESVIGTLQFIK